MKLDLLQLIQDHRVISSTLNLKEGILFIKVDDHSWFTDNRELLKDYELSFSYDNYSLFITLL